MSRPRLPRLKQQDMKDLRLAVSHLVAADNTLQRSGWASAAAVHELVWSAIMVIGPLHDRAEPAYLKILGETDPQALERREPRKRGGQRKVFRPRARQARPQEA